MAGLSPVSFGGVNIGSTSPPSSRTREVAAHRPMSKRRRVASASPSSAAQNNLQALFATHLEQEDITPHFGHAVVPTIVPRERVDCFLCRACALGCINLCAAVDLLYLWVTKTYFPIVFMGDKKKTNSLFSRFNLPTKTYISRIFKK